MHRLLVAFACFFFAGCAPYKPLPPSDSGAPQDTGAKEAAACVPDFQACNSTSVCCISSSICNINTGVCQTVCEGIGSVCSDNAQCCSGVCNGTCE